MSLGSGGRKCIMEVFWYLLAPIWLLRGQRQRHSRICWLPCPSIYLCIISSFIHSVSQSTFTCCCCCQVASVMSDSLRPHRQQPTRLPRPWDSPGKNTGVSCHFLLQCMKVKSESEVTQSCLTLSNLMDCSLPWDFPGKSTGVGCHCLLRNIYLAPTRFLDCLGGN